MKCLAGTMGTMGTMVYIDTLGIVVVQWPALYSADYCSMQVPQDKAIINSQATFSLLFLKRRPACSE